MKSDIKKFIDTLEENPLQGVELTPGVRKIRMAITSKGSGKSGGARIITYNILATEQDGEVFLLEIYDKADYSTIKIEVIKNIIEALNL